MIYIVSFMLSIFFAAIAQKEYKQKKIIGDIFSVLAILVPSILAGFRTTDIGIDIDVYVKSNFIEAQYYSSFFEFATKIDTDILYLALNFIVSRFTTNINVLLFIIQFINMSLVYSYIYTQREKHSMAMMYAIYLFMFYNLSLNLVRQSLALSIIIFGMKYVNSKKAFKYYITNFFAILMHSSAVIALPIYFLANMKDNKKNKWLKIVIIVGLLISIILYKNIIILLINLGILPIKYLAYLGIYARTSMNFNYAGSLFCLLWIFIYHSVSKRDTTFNNYRSFFMIIGLVFIQLSNFIEFADRIAYYYLIPGYILGDKSIQFFFTRSKSNIFISKIILLCLLLFYWYFTFVYFNTGETYPYVSIFG